MKSSLAIVFVFILASCKTYYDSSKVYFDNDVELIQKSKSLSFDAPLKIDFSGNLIDNSKDYKINGFIKIESIEHYQIFVFSKTFGVELCRIEIDRDSIIFLDKLNKMFFKGMINDFKYLNNNQISSVQYLQLILGRSFNNVDLIKTSNFNEYSYNYFSINGEVFLNTFGFVKHHKLVANDMVFNLNFTDYTIKHNCPSNVSGSIKLKNLSFNLKLNMVPVKSANILLNKFVVPNSFKEIL